MNSEPFGELDAPSASFDGEEGSSAPAWAQLVTLLWALSRARTGKLETARFRKVCAELQDCFAEYRSSDDRDGTADIAATWLSMGRSLWWSTDLRPDTGAVPEDVGEYNSTGGLSPAALVVARDDESCAEAVLDIVQNLPYTQGLEQLLAVLLFDDFIEFDTATRASHANESSQWYGLVDAERACGSHELANAASEGDWDEAFELLHRHAAGGIELVNTWRPGGVSWSTPLHQAARQGAPLKVAEVLVARGAWRSLPDADGLLPLDHAVRGGHAHLYDILAPPESSGLDRAIDRALEREAREAMHLICTESSMRRVPRLRTPPMAVLREHGGVLSFEVGEGELVLHFWTEDDELFIAYWWDESRKDGSVYILGPEGERRDAPWTGAFHNVDPAPAETRDDKQCALVDSKGDMPAAGVDEESTDLPFVAEPPLYSGQRILVGTSRRFGPFYLLGPHSKHAEMARRPEANSRAIGILVRRTESECSWAVLGRAWQHKIAAYDELPESDQWTDIILFCALFKRNALSDRLSAMAEFWASTGRDPMSTPEFVTTMREGLEERDMSALDDRWRPFARSVRTHGLAPNGNFGIEVENRQESNDAAFAQSALAAAGAPSKKGRSREFDNGLPMTLRTMTSDAQGRWDGRSMLVLAGSRAALNAQPGFTGGYADLRRQLEENGKLVREGNFLVFAQDHRFDAPSAAASVICGSSQNGRDIWLDGTSRNINTIEGGVKYVRTK